MLKFSELIKNFSLTECAEEVWLTIVIKQKKQNSNNASVGSKKDKNEGQNYLTVPSSAY